ncbi:MAG TPA: copper resistance CopC family protein [Thioalkalivibrio sp.]|nr:copper resistance CopC family protein [Thioalkalivibrio sp.]
MTGYLRQAIQWSALALLLALASPLGAHAQKEGTYPEDGVSVDGTPDRIAVWFDHGMRITFFELRGPRGVVELSERPGRDPVDRFEARSVTTLEPGEYTVKWRGLAEDGHAMFDEFTFTVR